MRRLQSGGFDISYYISVIVPIAPPVREALEGLSFDSAAFEESLIKSLSVTTVVNATEVLDTFSFGGFVAPPPENSVDALEDKVNFRNVEAINTLVDSNGTSVVIVYPSQVVVASRVVEEGGTVVLRIEVEQSMVVEIPLAILDLFPEEALVAVVTTIDLTEFLLRSNSSVGLAEDESVQAVASVNLANLETGELLVVEDLDTTNVGGIDLIFRGVNESVCKYWDEVEQAWSTRGLETVSYQDGVLHCKTTHLSFFASVASSFLAAFLCSQASLLTAEGLAELNSEGWYYEVTAVLLWMLLMCFSVLMVIAIWIDAHRFGGKGGWKDHYFLIALGNPPLSFDGDVLKEEGGRFAIIAWIAGMCEVVWETVSAAVHDMVDDLLSVLCSHLEELRTTLESIWEAISPALGASTEDVQGDLSVALCAAIAQASYRKCCHTHASTQLGIYTDDVLSEAKEALTSAMHVEEEVEEILHTWHRAAVSVAPATDDVQVPIFGAGATGAFQSMSSHDWEGDASSGRRGSGIGSQEGPSGGSQEDSRDGPSGSHESAQVRRRGRAGRGGSFGSQGSQTSLREHIGQRRKKHKEIVDRIDAHVEQRRALQGRSAAALDRGSSSATTVHQLQDWELRRNAILESLADLHTDAAQSVGDNFMSWSSLPGSVLHVFMFGGPIGSVFSFSMYSPSSIRAMQLVCDVMGAAAVSTLFMSVTGTQPSKKNTARCGTSDLAGIIGHLLAIGLASGILAAFPVSIIGRFHTREFKQMDYEGSPAWKRQLRNWLFRDILFWVSSVSYAGFCVLYILLFFANVAPQDQGAWMFSAGMSLMDDFMLGPMLMALAPPLLLMCLLSFIAWKKGSSIREVVEAWEAEAAEKEQKGLDKDSNGTGSQEVRGEKSESMVVVFSETANRDSGGDDDIPADGQTALNAADAVAWVQRPRDEEEGGGFDLVVDLDLLAETTRRMAQNTPTTTANFAMTQATPRDSEWTSESTCVTGRLADDEILVPV